MKEILTLIFLNDHRAPQAFKIPHFKIILFGISLTAVILMAVFSSIYFVKTSIQMKANPFSSGYSQSELEQKLSEFQTKNQELESQLRDQSTRTQSQAPASFLFVALPPESNPEQKLPDPETLPFKIEKPTVVWKNQSLMFSSAINYTKDDGGTQQGRFVILARGPHHIIAYPDLVFASAGDSIIQPEQGEYFSVSRYREIKANFGPVFKHDDLQSLDFLIFDQNKKLIYVDRIVVPKTTSAVTKPSPAPQVKPSPAISPITAPSI